MKIKTPKPFYFEHGAVQFRVKRKEVFYSVSIWNESGTTLSLIKTGEYNKESPESLLV